MGGMKERKKRKQTSCVEADRRFELAVEERKCSCSMEQGRISLIYSHFLHCQYTYRHSCRITCYSKDPTSSETFACKHLPLGETSCQSDHTALASEAAVSCTSKVVALRRQAWCRAHPPALRQHPNADLAI
jgi:hypothetical protein